MSVNEMSVNEMLVDELTWHRSDDGGVRLHVDGDRRRRRFARPRHRSGSRAEKRLFDRRIPLPLLFFVVVVGGVDGVLVITVGL
jgi:hypothetical protein